MPCAFLFNTSSGRRKRPGSGRCSLGFVRSVAAYVEAVKRVEIPLTLVVGILFCNERERVQAIWPGSMILMVGSFWVIFAS
jgi:hypothetical protein